MPICIICSKATARVATFGAHRPLVNPRWPPHNLWPHQCNALRLGVLTTKFGGHRAFLSNLTRGWPDLPLHGLWHQQCTMFWARVLPKNLVAMHRAFLSNLTSAWPRLTPAWPLIPSIYYTSVMGSSNFGGRRAFLYNLTPGWPRLTPAWPLTTAIHYPRVQGSFTLNLVTIEHFEGNLTPGWPLTFGGVACSQTLWARPRAKFQRDTS